MSTSPARTLRKGFLERTARGRRIAIHARDGRLWKRFAHRLFDSLGAVPDRCDVIRAALGATRGRALAVAAMVAAQVAGTEMDDEIRAAPRARRMPAAGAAMEHRRKAAPVDEDKALLAAFEAFPEVR
jgi:hypothetical protein